VITKQIYGNNIFSKLKKINLLILYYAKIDAHEVLNSALITTIKKLHSGYLNGARVALGKLEDFIKTACLTSLTFFGNDERGLGKHH